MTKEKGEAALSHLLRRESSREWGDSSLSSGPGHIKLFSASIYPTLKVALVTH